MNVLRFRARNAADAVNQIHSQLGAEAVVLSVTPLPTPGLSRLWRKPRLEVLAGLPVPDVQRPQPRGGLQESATQNLESETREESSARSAERCIAVQATEFTSTESSIEHPDVPDSGRLAPPGLGGHWRSGLVLHQMGLQPLYVENVLERARESHGDLPPASLAQELTLVRRVLASFWRSPPRAVNNSPERTCSSARRVRARPRCSANGWRKRCWGRGSRLVPGGWTAAPPTSPVCWTFTGKSLA